MNATLAERWKAKLRERTDRKSLGKWAVHLFDVLLDTPELRASSFRDLARATGVPLKFVHRAVAVLYRFGLIGLQVDDSSVVVVLQQRTTLKARRPPGARSRSRFTKAEVYELDKGRCAMTGKRVKVKDAELDHIIPFAYGGADDLANLTIMTRDENRDKKSSLYPSLKSYRGESVRGVVGMHWRDGAFYPVINGRRRGPR